MWGGVEGGLSMDVRKAVSVANGLGWGWSCTRVMIWVVNGAWLQGSTATDGSCRRHGTCRVRQP